VVRSALKAYNRLIELDASGEQPLYRPRSWKRLERTEERRRNRGAGEESAKPGTETVVLYRKGGFVPATPRSQLRNQFMREIKETGFRIKAVEQSGVTGGRHHQKYNDVK